MKHTIKVLIFTLVLSPLTLSASKISFEDDVWPVLRERCIGCHGAPYYKRGKLRKAGGGLRLDAPGRIRAGAEDNAHVVVDGHPDRSSLVKRLRLPEDDDDVMPPKGKLLTEEQIETFENWIRQGADYGEWIGLPEEYNYKELKKSWKKE